MAAKRGQPPKPPDERKSVNKNVAFTESQIAAIEVAKEKESPEKKVSTYIRDIVVDHAEKVIKKHGKK